MTESIVQTQTHQTDVCKEIVTDGIYTVCAETGEVIEYDYDRFFVSNSEGINKESKSKTDKVYSHYQRHYTLLPNKGIGTIPVKFDNKLKYYAFAYRVSTLITNSVQKAIFMRIAQKIPHIKIKHKLYILGAFAVHYCSVDFNRVVSLILNFSQEDEETVKQKLSYAISNISYILSEKLGLPGVETQMRKQLIQQLRFELLYRYGYLSKIDKFSKLHSFGIIKIAVILLLLRDNRKNEAIELYKYRPEYNTGFKHFVVDYEINGTRYVKRLTHGRLRTLLFSSSRLHNFKIIL